MKLLPSAIAAALSVIPASLVYAAPVTTWTVDVSSIFVESSVVSSGSGSVTFVSDQELRWGTSTGSGQSGLIISDSPSSEQVDTNGAAVANVTVTHENQPITDTSLDSVDIASTLTLTPFIPANPGLPPATITFGVNFLETPNTATPCADGAANGSGVNSNGCSDIFVISQDALNFEFQYDDPDGEIAQRSYFISFFEITNGLNPLSPEACAAAGASSPCLGFQTPEGEDTPFQFASLITTTPVFVPEPGIVGLLGLGLSAMGISFLGRRKINQ